MATAVSEAERINIVVVGTLDTKLAEFLYLRSQILEANPSINVILIDAGRAATVHDAITVSQAEVYRRACDLVNDNDNGSGEGSTGNSSNSRTSTATQNKPLNSLPRAEIVKTMIRGAASIVRELLGDDDDDNTDGNETAGGGGKIHGVVGLGGSGGTSIASGVMRALPLTLPKLILSTVASGDTSSYVAESDITMMYSVVDVAGLNEVLRAVIRNAAFAIAGMAQGYFYRYRSVLDDRKKENKKKRGVGITMFGVTTPAADVARRYLEAHGFEVYVFHATGAGGRAMERLISEHRLDGVLDLTTTELADELVGGVFSAGPERLKAAARAGIPQIVSVGALDMVNYGPRDTVPALFRCEREIYEHNPSVTLVRTAPDECAELGRRLASRLRENQKKKDSSSGSHVATTEVWIPLKGVSAISVKGQVFHDKKADEALFDAIRKGLDGSGIVVREVDADINDPTWAEDMARRLTELMSEV